MTAHRHVQRNAEIIDAVEQGEPQQIVAGRYGLSVSRIGQIHAQSASAAKRHTTKLEERIRRDAEIVTAIERGESRRAVAERHGLTKPRVFRIVAQGGSLARTVRDTPMTPAERAQRDAAIVDAAKRGENRQAIADRHGLSNCRVAAIIRTSPEPVMKDPRSVRHHLDYGQLRQAYEGGLDAAKLANIKGVAYSTMYSGLKRAGTQFRPRGGTQLTRRAAELHGGDLPHAFVQVSR